LPAPATALDQRAATKRGVYGGHILGEPEKGRSKSMGTKEGGLWRRAVKGVLSKRRKLMGAFNIGGSRELEKF